MGGAKTVPRAECNAPGTKIILKRPYGLVPPICRNLRALESCRVQELSSLGAAYGSGVVESVVQEQVKQRLEDVRPYRSAGGERESGGCKGEREMQKRKRDR